MALKQHRCAKCGKMATWVPSKEIFFCWFCGNKFKEADILGFLKGFGK